MSELTDLADAIAAEINTNDLLGAGVNAVRAYVPVYDASRTADLKAFVVPIGVELTTETRALDRHKYVVSTAIYQRTGAVGGTSTLDPLMALVEGLVDHFRALRIVDDKVLVGIGNQPVFDPEAIEKSGVFCSVVQMTFMALR